MQFRIVSGPSCRSPIAQRGVMRVAPCILVEPGSVMLWPSKFNRWKKLKLHFKWTSPGQMLKGV